jgi:CRISPR-associated exonuclease Cas4
MPVEHKWGRGAGDLRPLIIQATAQAICLEEMLDIEVPSVAVYIVTERRRELATTADWRDAVLEVVAAARVDLLSQGPRRPPYQARRCGRCSLLEACQPQEGN